LIGPEDGPNLVGFLAAANKKSESQGKKKGDKGAPTLSGMNGPMTWFCMDQHVQSLPIQVRGTVVGFAPFWKHVSTRMADLTMTVVSDALEHPDDIKR